jgi:hypothetical protein
MLKRHLVSLLLSDAIVTIPAEMKDDTPKNEMVIDEIHTFLSDQRAQDTVLQCDDLVRHMLTFVEMCDKVLHLPLVNKMFNRACMHSASWHAAWVNAANPVAMFMAFAHRMPRLHTLRLNCNTSVHAPLLRHAMVHCPALSEIYGATRESQVAVEMLRAFPKLCTLNLFAFPLLANGEWLGGDGGMFRNITVLRVVAYHGRCAAPHDMLACFPSLEVYSGPIDDGLLHAMAVHCPSLRVVKFSDVPDNQQYEDGCLAVLRSVGHQLVHLNVPARLCEIGPSIVEHCRVLECLCLREFEQHTLSDDLLADILTRVGPTLRVLELRNCIALTNQAAVLIGAKCPRLVDLQWYGGANVDGEGLRAIAEGCPLQRMQIDKSNATLEMFGATVLQCRSMVYMAIGNIIGYDEAVCQSLLLYIAAKRIALQLAPVEVYFYVVGPNGMVCASVGKCAQRYSAPTHFCECAPSGMHTISRG